MGGVLSALRKAMAADDRQALTDEEKRRVAQAAVQAAQAALAGEADATVSHTLAGIIYHGWVSTFEATLLSEAANAGFSGGVVKLTDPQILAALQEQSAATASGIMKTFEKDLLSFVHALPADTDPSVVPSLVARWNLQRDIWKIPQIAITETAKARGAAQKEFVKRSGAKGTATFGGSLQCPVCQGIAAGNPYDLGDFGVFEIPHPHCLDSWTVHYQSIGRPWQGD